MKQDKGDVTLGKQMKATFHSPPMCYVTPVIASQYETYRVFNWNHHEKPEKLYN